MGKRDTRYSYPNPILLARFSKKNVTGPTIKDYLSRDRPTWDEVKKRLLEKRKENAVLAAWEDSMNKKFREELDKDRAKLLGESSREGRARKKPKKRKRSRSRSSSLSTSDSSRNSHALGEEEPSRKKRKKKHKHKLKSESSSKKKKLKREKHKKHKERKRKKKLKHKEK